MIMLELSTSQFGQGGAPRQVELHPLERAVNRRLPHGPDEGASRREMTRSRCS